MSSNTSVYNPIREEFKNEVRKRESVVLNEVRPQLY